MKMRINKFLAKAGIGSRRGVEKYITEGRVSVNGVIIIELSRANKKGYYQLR